MSWIKRFFGAYDKKQKKENEKVEAYIEKKHDQRSVTIEKIRKMNRKIQEKNEKLKTDGIELVTMVQDVTAQIAKITEESR